MGAITMGDRIELPCGCVIKGKETHLCPAHAIAEDKRLAGSHSPLWRRLDYSLSGLAILFVLVWFGGAAIVAIGAFILRLARDFSLDLLRQAFDAVVLWLGAVAVAVVLFVFADRLIRHLRH
jgi:hypothetical protein